MKYMLEGQEVRVDTFWHRTAKIFVSHFLNDKDTVVGYGALGVTAKDSVRRLFEHNEGRAQEISK